MKIRTLRAFGANLVLAGILLLAGGLTGCQPEAEPEASHVPDYGYIQVEVTADGPAPEIKKLGLNINYYWYLPSGARTDVSSQRKNPGGLLPGLVWQEHIVHKPGRDAFAVHVVPTSNIPHTILRCKIRIFHDSDVADSHDEKSGDLGTAVICRIDNIDHKK